jgi:hypothetical protein
VFRAVYRQITRFLNWVNGTGSGSRASLATKEAADYRRDVASSSARGDGPWFADGGGDGGGD